MDREANGNGIAAMLIITDDDNADELYRSNNSPLCFCEQVVQGSIHDHAKICSGRLRRT